MLELDPNQRPTLAQVMSHPWLAPHLYRLATTLGAISTSKVSDYFGYLQGPTFDNKAKKGYLRKKGCLPISKAHYLDCYYTLGLFTEKSKAFGVEKA